MSNSEYIVLKNTQFRRICVDSRKLAEASCIFFWLYWVSAAPEKSSANRDVQTQVRDTLTNPMASERTAPISTLVPGVDTLSSLEKTAASGASIGPSFISQTNQADLLAGTQAIAIFSLAKTATI